MSLHSISYSDQLISKDTSTNQRRNCSICFDTQPKKTSVLEQDYLLFRKIVKVAAITVGCVGTVYLLYALSQRIYDIGRNDGIIEEQIKVHDQLAKIKNLRNEARSSLNEAKSTFEEAENLRRAASLHLDEAKELHHNISSTTSSTTNQLNLLNSLQVIFIHFMLNYHK